MHLIGQTDQSLQWNGKGHKPKGAGETTAGEKADRSTEFHHKAEQMHMQ